jgi:hypothetical protein
MKTILLTISLTMLATISFGQFEWGIDFDPPYYQYVSDRIIIDTVSNINCLWQVGHPSKVVFSSAFSNPNAIVTDTSNAVPSNDTSIFYIKHVRDQFAPFHIFGLHFKYQMDGDATDRGIIEISPDTGNTWINPLTQDTTFHMVWYSPKPTLKGSTTDWQTFDLYMNEWATGWATFPIYLSADTILFRFTYITDNNSTIKDGWIIDNIEIEDWWEGIEEYNKDLTIIYPNPVSDKINISNTVKGSKQTIQITNLVGQLQYYNSDFNGKPIDTKFFKNGIYILKYSNQARTIINKFIVNH